MSEAIHDMVAYTKLNDTVIQQIMISEETKFDKVPLILSIKFSYLIM